MKSARLAITSIVAIMSIAAIVPSVQAQERTRDQVKQELVQARHDGIVPVGNAQYPNTPRMIETNKTRHAIAKHPGETSPAYDEHDNIAFR
ncbi:MAG TPA: DUF4148 domain-containing protein [Paraburkholderia sp.]|nr:DUF4148 domain-containing protein [Paraburkholderia sp.]